MKSVNKIRIVDFVILLISTGFVVITLFVWPYFKVGWFVITILLGVMLSSFYILYRNKNTIPIFSVYLLYCIFLLLYFFIWGYADWGTAFIAYFIIHITPLFLVLNLVGLTTNILTTRKRV